MPGHTRGTAPQGLIMSKLNPPELDQRTLWRTQLIERALGYGGRARVTGIVAAAGSGKSTLMAQLFGYFRDGKGKTGWLSLDADDDNPATFASYFVATLRAMDLPLAELDLTLTGANKAPDVEALLDNLVALLSGVTEAAAIFLDDFHQIRDPTILAFVGKLVAHASPSIRLVIASRSTLPLDLSRQRVSGQLLTVEQDDLNFDASQAADFLRKTHDLRLDADDLAVLLSSTEGWPAGLQLAALALRRHTGATGDFIRSFSGRDQDLVGYLGEAVLRGQPAHVRRFLLRTSPLRRMSAELCRAVAGTEDSAGMLRYLVQSGLFVISLDREGRWYRYHHLFADFLVKELRAGSSSEFAEVCDRATTWCDEQGQTTEAIQYALDGGHYDKATDLIAKHAPIVAQIYGDHYTVLDWMRRLPEAYHWRHPEIVLSDAWSRAFARDTGRAIHLADGVAEELRGAECRWNLDERENNRLFLLARVIRAISLACADKIEDCMALAEDVQRQMMAADPFLTASILNCVGYCHFARREYDRCTRAAADAYLFSQRATSAYPSIWADFLHGLADVELGRLQMARERGTRAAAAAKDVEGTVRSYSTTLAALLNAQISIQRCDFAAAANDMEIGRSFSAMYGPLEPLLISIRSEARIEVWRGRIDKTRAVLAKGQDLALRTQQPRLFGSLAIEEATLLVCAGEASAAEETVERARLREKLWRTSSLGDAIRLLEVRFHLAEKMPDQALRTLTLLQHGYRGDTGGSVALTLRTLRAVALWQAGRGADAGRELDRALAAAAPEFNCYPIAACGTVVLPLLRAVAERRNDAGACLEQARIERAVISVLSGDACADAPREDAADLVAPVEALTARERELLRLVDAGLGNRQLADALLISEATAKWHLHNIFMKLGVRSRTAAVARARELGTL